MLNLLQGSQTQESMIITVLEYYTLHSVHAVYTAELMYTPLNDQCSNLTNLNKEKIKYKWLELLRNNPRGFSQLILYSPERPRFEHLRT